MNAGLHFFDTYLTNNLIISTKEQHNETLPEETSYQNQGLENNQSQEMSESGLSLLNSYNRSRIQNAVKYKLDFWLNRESTLPGQFNYSHLHSYCTKLSPQENFEMLIYGAELLRMHSTDIRLIWTIHANLEMLCDQFIPFRGEFISKIWLLLIEEQKYNLDFLTKMFALLEQLHSFKKKLTGELNSNNKSVHFIETKLIKWNHFFETIFDLLPHSISSTSKFSSKQVIHSHHPLLIKFLFHNKIAIKCYHDLYLIAVTESTGILLPFSSTFSYKNVKNIDAKENLELAEELKKLPELRMTVRKFIKKHINKIGASG